jgi:hypothetical protein
MIANPGYPIGHIHVKRLKILHYYAMHLKRFQRQFIPAESELDLLNEIYKLKEQEDEAESLNYPEKLTSFDKVRRMTENIDAWILQKIGVTCVPLAYVTRLNPVPPLEAIDHLFGQPSYHDDMIRRAPHSGISYHTDNNTVWNMIRAVLHGRPGWGWIQSHQNEMDGRGANNSLKKHYFGESFAA